MACSKKNIEKNTEKVGSTSSTSGKVSLEPCYENFIWQFDWKELFFLWPFPRQCPV